MSCQLVRWIALVLLGAVLSGCGKKQQPEPQLLLLCAAGMREPVSKIVREFENESGIAVDIQLAGSGTLLAMMEQVRADLYLAADRGYIEEASQRGFVISRHSIGAQSPVLAWNSGKNLEVANLSEWVRTARYPGIAIPETAVIGKVTEEVMKEAGVWSELKPHAEFVTVYELANAIRLGSVDSGIVWDNVANGIDGITVNQLPETAEIVSEVEVAVLVSSRFLGAATQLAEFMAEGGNGRSHFENHGLRMEGAP